MTIVIDFDGVIHKYSKGWDDGSCYDEPVDGVLGFLQKLQIKGYSLVVQSTRNPKQVVNWFNQHTFYRVMEIPYGMDFWNEKEIIGITNHKLPAKIYIDDRGLKFEGKFDDEFMNAIDNFKTWQQD